MKLLRKPPSDFIPLWKCLDLIYLIINFRKRSTYYFNNRTYLEETNLFPACMRSKASFIFSSRIVCDISLSRFIFPAIYSSDSLGIISRATHPPNNKTWKKDRNAFFLAGLEVCNSNYGPIVFYCDWRQSRRIKNNKIIKKNKKQTVS